VIRTNDQVLGFWRRMGFTETGEVRPWRYDTQLRMAAVRVGSSV
jgi:ribosomal protein S18 acetylase RimI-like enzyme